MQQWSQLQWSTIISDTPIYNFANIFKAARLLVPYPYIFPVEKRVLIMPRRISLLGSVLIQSCSSSSAAAGIEELGDQCKVVCAGSLLEPAGK
jgi:hypothetical protein